MHIREAWEKSLQREGHVRDEAQEALVNRLQALQSTLERSSDNPGPWLLRVFGRSAVRIRGLYIWGGVGRGKTFLMDLFFENLEIEGKRRMHFHRLMKYVHESRQAYADTEDPVDRVAAEIAQEIRVLCFDEFFVSDIGDAMILGRLLEGLFGRGVTLVATSNAHPDDLYRNGLQRGRFLPAIERLKSHTEIWHLGGDTDYRLRLLQKSGTYLQPANEAANAALAALFRDSASSAVRAQCELDVNGRPIPALRAAKGIVWFRFDDICDGPRSQADYIELARWYPTIIVSDVPVFDQTLEDQARRFIALVDEFYERRVKLIMSAAAIPKDLYAGRKLAFEFERTVSRLNEMQTEAYLAAEHLP